MKNILLFSNYRQAFTCGDCRTQQVKKTIVRTGLPFMLAALGLCSTGCTPSDTSAPVVKVNLDEPASWEELNKVLEIDSIIPIKTGENYGLRHISKAIYRGHEIYLHEGNGTSIYKYNIQDGSFRQIINQAGHAGNEYNRIDSYNMDDEQQIYILDSSSSKVLVFDNEGNFIRTIRDVTQGNTLAISHDGSFAIVSSHFNKDALVTAYSSDGKQTYSTPPSELTLSYSAMTKGNILAHGDEYIFSTMFDNNIYRTNSAEPTVMVTFDYGDKNPDIAEAEAALDFSKGSLNLDKLYAMVSYTDNFCLYKQYLTFQAGMGPVVIYDTKQKTALVAWNGFFADALAVSPEGNFCVPSMNSHLNYLRQSKDSTLVASYLTHPASEYEENDCYLVMGHFK